ncbi:MAG: hypothetical protein ABSB71_07760 [Candidatus Bathyarchaeia archaeon]|jgi:bifunctional DNA-binding transcriptional regulator/antitoxin component of YhaV-PrlF toxin-antitoxin module
MNTQKPDTFTTSVQELFRLVIPVTMRELWAIQVGDILEVKICGVHKKEA